VEEVVIEGDGERGEDGGEVKFSWVCIIVMQDVTRV